jgi:hypothetical protein
MFHCTQDPVHPFFVIVMYDYQTESWINNMCSSGNSAELEMCPVMDFLTNHMHADSSKLMVHWSNSV